MYAITSAQAVANELGIPLHKATELINNPDLVTEVISKTESGFWFSIRLQIEDWVAGPIDLHKKELEWKTSTQ